MTIRIEVMWRPTNLRATATHLYQHLPDVVGREPLNGVDDAEGFLIERLKAQLDHAEIEEKSYDCFVLYRPGYWAQLALSDEPQQKGSDVVSAMPSGSLKLTGMLNPDSFGSFSLDRPSERSQTRLARVNFLVQLG